MTRDLAIPSPAGTIAPASGFILPAVIADQADERFFTFFTDTCQRSSRAWVLVRLRSQGLLRRHRDGISASNPPIFMQLDGPISRSFLAVVSGAMASASWPGSVRDVTEDNGSTQRIFQNEAVCQNSRKA